MSSRLGFVVLALSLTLALSQISPAAQAAEDALCAGHSATIVGDPDVPEVIGTPGRDVIIGSGHNHIQGLGGDDLICGTVLMAEDDGDFVEGGDDNDTIYDGRVISGGSGNDQIYGVDDISISGGPGNDRIIGTARTSINGDDGDDYIKGYGSDGGVFGGGGNDTLISSDHSIYGGEGNDLLEALPGTDRGGFHGGPGNDKAVAGKTGQWTFWDEEGDDRYYANGNHDAIVAYLFSFDPIKINLTKGVATGQGRDRLYGVRNASGSSHDDQIIGDEHANTILGASQYPDLGVDPTGVGSDRVYGRGGNDFISSLGPNTLVNGGRGNDTIEVSGRGFGGRGNDTLGGAYTDDRLVGGRGRDSADGKAGIDTCLAETTVDCEIGGS